MNGKKIFSANLLDAGRSLRSDEEDDEKERQSVTAAQDVVVCTTGRLIRRRRVREFDILIRVGISYVAIRQTSDASFSTTSGGSTLVARKFLTLVLLVLFSGAAHAQRRQSDLARGFELERAGRLDEAAEEYVRALDINPANLSALLGLERVLTPSNQLNELEPRLDSALVIQPDNRSVRSLQMRVLTALEDEGALESAARDWIAVSPGSAEPYAEWARAMIKLGDAEAATSILGEGVMTVGDAALAQDMAELSAETGDWLGAATQWRDAVISNPALLSTAVANLSQAPPENREEISNLLTSGSNDEVGARLGADLLLGWGNPMAAWRLLDDALTGDIRVVPHLRRFADRARLQRGPEAARARGLALERIAGLSTGVAAERTRIEAARAFVEAGDRGAAERMLARIAQETDPNQQNAATAISTLIRVMAESGRVDEAEERFNEWVDRLPRDDVPMLRDRIVWGWITEGDLDRAEQMLAADSTVQTLALRGWLTLYRGDLRGATDYFRLAGPRAGSREEATERTTVLALIQQIETDTVPELGEGLLLLRRGDSSRAVGILEDAAKMLPADEGASDVYGFAGMVAVEVNDAQTAERLLKAAFNADSAGTAAPPRVVLLGQGIRADGSSRPGAGTSRATDTRVS